MQMFIELKLQLNHFLRGAILNVNFASTLECKIIQLNFTSEN